MPYINQQARDRLDPALQHLFNKMWEDKGEFVYVVFKIAKRWLDLRMSQRKGEPLHYITRSNAVSILADAHHEFRRRYLDEYEDKKREEHGDI